MRKYYLKEKESGVEFPRAYYVANPNKTEEENKSNSRRIRALMLKVAKNLELDEATETNNAVILGEELTAGADGDCKGKNCIRLGAESKLIQEINIRLAGFGGNVPTEKFTPRTVTMVKQFQKDYMQIEPTGNICGDTLKAIDEFGDKYTFPFEEIKCKCGVCTGFGQSQYKNEYKDTPEVEANHKYEYPGIHRSLLWAHKAIIFYTTSQQYKDYNYTVKCIFSGYRCHENNKQNERTSTNHMGKAIDIHFYKNGKRDVNKVLVSDMEEVRDKVIKPSNKSQVRWANKNLFSIEPSKRSYPTEFIATTWIHIDVRQFETDYLKDEFFADTVIKLKGKKIVDLAKEEGFTKTCDCLGGYTSQQGASTSSKGDKERVDPKTLKVSDKLIEFIKDWEKFEPNVYDDSKGYATIGYGHLIERKSKDDITIPDEFKNGITEEEATTLFKKDLIDYEKAVQRDVTVNLYQKEFDALVDLLFNCGAYFLKNGKAPKLYKNLLNKEYEAAAIEFLDIENKTRRQQNYQMFIKGNYDSTH